MPFNNKYCLFNKNNIILSFHCDRDINGTPNFVTDEQFSNKVPYGYKNINMWIANRRAPKHRNYIKEILKKCGCDDLEDYIRFTYCAGLNDTFWVKPQESDLTWEKVSLYQNEFDENIARMAFDGRLMGEKCSSASPELTTDGTFPKCWIRKNNQVYLLKQGTKLYKNTTYSEQYAYDLSQIICDNALPYEIVKHHGKIAARCPLFTSEKISFAPIISILGEDAPFDKILDFYESIGAGDKFRQMMLLDALIINPDRHLKNYGFLYDADTMEILDMAPVFDNNLSLCPSANISELQNIQKYMRSRNCAFEEGFNEVVFKCMNKDLQNKLIMLKDFKFNRNHKYHLPEERIELLENMVQMQIDNLLNRRVISPQYEKAEEVSIENLSIELIRDNIAPELYNVIKSEAFIIPQFTIVTDKGSSFTVTENDYCVNENDKSITIEIFDAEVDGYSDSLRVKEIKGLNIISQNYTQSVEIPAKKIEIELSITEETLITSFRDITIYFNYSLSNSHTRDNVPNYKM